MKALFIRRKTALTALEKLSTKWLDVGELHFVMVALGNRNLEPDQASVERLEEILAEANSRKTNNER